MFSKLLVAALIGLGASASQAEAAITVNSAASAGQGTLRAAINQANINPNLSRIGFDLPTVGTVITPLTDLPAITAPIEIDGYTQPGSAPAPATGPAHPIVVIDAVNTTRALELNTDGSLVQGLTIFDSSGNALPDGIQVAGDKNRIEGSHIGTSTTGVTKGFQNLATGVAITGDGNVVGGQAPEDGNVIAEIDGDGVTIAGDDNQVLGNRIGLPHGVGSFGNAGIGIAVTGDENVIGGGRNVISQNGGDGAAIAGNGNRVEGNYVGLDAAGAGQAGNAGYGISLVGNQNVATGNVSSGNITGVFVDGNSNSLTANALGTDAAEAAAVPNFDDGVHVAGGALNLVEDNLIAGNQDSGVEIVGGQNHRVEGNDIGSAALPNLNGVLIDSSFNTVAGNTLSGHIIGAGVSIDGDAVGPPPIQNVVEDNDIADNLWGVHVEDGHENAITGNKISGSGAHGVLIDAIDLPNADENRLHGNTIKGSVLSGVEIDGGDENLVGELDYEINTITGNGLNGVTVATGQRNAIVNNSIYDNTALGIDLANDGVDVNDGLGDPDSGPNGYQNHPDITGHRLTRVELDEFPFVLFKSQIYWTLSSAAATDYRLEFYLNDSCGVHREAKELLASRDVTTDGTGFVDGSILVTPVTAKVTVTATALDAGGDLGPTSELSACG